MAVLSSFKKQSEKDAYVEIADRTGFSKANVKKVIDEYNEYIFENLVKNNEIYLPAVDEMIRVKLDIQHVKAFYKKENGINIFVNRDRVSLIPSIRISAAKKTIIKDCYKEKVKSESEINSK